MDEQLAKKRRVRTTEENADPLTEAAGVTQSHTNTEAVTPTDNPPTSPSHDPEKYEQVQPPDVSPVIGLNASPTLKEEVDHDPATAPIEEECNVTNATAEGSHVPSKKADTFGVQLLPKIAEKEGFNLAQFEEGVWEILALAVEYKLRTLVDEALRICRRSLHRQSSLCLDSKSVLLALKLLHWEQVPPAALRTRSESPKTLDECMEQDLGAPLPLLPSLSVKWVALNGTMINPQYARNLMEDREPQASWQYVPNVQTFKRDFINTQAESRFIMSVIFDDHSADRADSAVKILTIPKGLTDSLGEEDKLFLRRISAVVTSAVRDSQSMRSDDSERAQIRVALEKVIRSLSEGRIPPKLLPYILSLLCGEVSNVVLEGTSEGVLILLDLLRALTQNQNLQLNAYLHQIIQALFTCMLTPLIGGATTIAVQAAMTVRRSAAETLATIVTQSATVSGSVAAYSSVVEIVSEVLKKPYLPLPTLLGAIMGAKALGPSAVKRAVMPVTRDLIDALKMSLQENNRNLEVAETREFLKSAMLELLMACTNLVNNKLSGSDPMQNLIL